MQPYFKSEKTDKTKMHNLDEVVLVGATRARRRRIIHTATVLPVEAKQDALILQKLKYCPYRNLS